MQYLSSRDSSRSLGIFLHCLLFLSSSFSILEDELDLDFMDALVLVVHVEDDLLEEYIDESEEKVLLIDVPPPPSVLYRFLRTRNIKL